MKRQMKTLKGYDGEFQQNGATGQAILELLLARDMRPGDSINIILAQFEIERKGIDTTEFSVGGVQLLENGLIDMQGNAFYLTDAGFEALRHGTSGAHA